MALLKSKAAKAAAATDAARILSANPADALEISTQGSAADWSIAQLSAIYTEHRTQLVSRCHSAKALLAIPPPIPRPHWNLSKDSFQKGTTFGPQRCLN